MKKQITRGAQPKKLKTNFCSTSLIKSMFIYYLFFRVELRNPLRIFLLLLWSGLEQFYWFFWFMGIWFYLILWVGSWAGLEFLCDLWGNTFAVIWRALYLSWVMIENLIDYLSFEVSMSHCSRNSTYLSTRRLHFLKVQWTF